MKSNLLLSLFLFFQIHLSEAQYVIPENRIYYAGKNYFYWGIPSLNTDEKFSLQLNHSGYSGLRKVINSTYLNGIYTGWLEKNGIALGATLINDQQGTYIGYTQLRANTAYKVNLNDNFYNIFSLSMGLGNLTLGGSTTSGGGGSAFSSDWSAGNWLVYKNIKWGLALDHLIKSKFEPMGTIYNFNKKLVSVFVYESEIARINSKNKVSMLNAWYLLDDYKLLILTEEFIYQNKLRFILNTVNLDLIGYGGGLNLNENGRSHFSLNFVFYSTLKQRVVVSNKYELMLAFGFK